MQTNDRIVAMLQIAWEMTQETVRHVEQRQGATIADLYRQEFARNYQAIEEAATGDSGAQGSSAG